LQDGAAEVEAGPGPLLVDEAAVTVEADALVPVEEVDAHDVLVPAVVQHERAAPQHVPALHGPERGAVRPAVARAAVPRAPVGPLVPHVVGHDPIAPRVAR